MKNHVIRQVLRWPAATIPTALLALFGLPILAAGSDVQMSHVSDTLVEIAGGRGLQAWRLRYGTHGSYNKELVADEEHRAWFSHGGWLRLIDTKKGVVIGRWHFPGTIVALNPAKEQATVEVEDKLNDRVFHRTIPFLPSADAVVPYWPTGSLLLNRVPMTEVESAWRFKSAAGLLSDTWKIPAEGEVKKLRTELEEAVRRDPTAPAIRIALWRVLREVQDQQAAAVLEEALQVALLHDSTAARVGALFQLLVQDTTAQDFGLPSSAIRLRM